MERIDVSILGREYSLSCEADQKESLLSAIRMVDQRMQAIKASGKLSGNERIAVMAAVQTAVELLSTRAPDGPLGNVVLGDVKSRLDNMHRLLDQVSDPASAQT